LVKKKIVPDVACACTKQKTNGQQRTLHMAEEDLMCELHELFDQVRLEKWYPILFEHTMFTSELPLSIQEAQAIVEAYDLPKTEKLQSPVLQQLKERLNSFLSVEPKFKSHDGEKLSVFMKCAHRSPKDAARMSPRTNEIYEQIRHQFSNTFCGRLHALFKASMMVMEVTSGEEAIELLVNSENIKDDLFWSLMKPELWSMTLVFRGWVEMDPTMEFRCFISKQKVTAVTPWFYTLYSERNIKNREKIIQEILGFFESIKSKLDDCGLGKEALYTMDLFIDMNSAENDELPWKIWIIELNPLETSNWFLFQPGKDRNQIFNGPFELRLPEEETTEKILEIGDVPNFWEEMLLSTK
jgi:hypothetical protein